MKQIFAEIYHQILSQILRIQILFDLDTLWNTGYPME